MDQMMKRGRSADHMPLAHDSTMANGASQPSDTGRPASPGKSADAPGRRFKAMGLTNASTLTRGYAQKATKGTRG